MSDVKWKPSQNRYLGWLLVAVGFLAFVGCIIVPFILIQDEDWQMLLVVAMFFGGASVVIYGKRHLTRDANHLLAKDPRPPVIYLRSFGGEADTFSVRSFFRAVGTQFTNRGAGLDVSPWDPTLQAQLAIVMNRIGPYIAIGRPGAKLPGTGAARLYVPDSEWQQRVGKLIRKAQLVILRAGTSKGLEWEIQTLTQNIKPERLLILLPHKKKDYIIFGDLIREHRIILPDKIPNSLFLTFDQHWKPVPLETKGKLEVVLSPYFKANNIPPPKSKFGDSLRLLFQ